MKDATDAQRIHTSHLRLISRRPLLCPAHCPPPPPFRLAAPLSNRRPRRSKSGCHHVHHRRVRLSLMMGPKWPWQENKGVPNVLETVPNANAA